jgi:predicted molibdopterin-dependent oxidoreductase YjgC
MTNSISIVVDGRTVHVADGSTLLQAAAHVSRELSTLCACRIPCLEACCGLCVVEVEGEFALKRACSYLIDRPLSCQTYTRSVRRERRRVLSTLLSRHQHKCSTCSKRRACALRSLARSYDVFVQTKRQSEKGMR